jgi:hypothetical protein
MHQLDYFSSSIEHSKQRGEKKKYNKLSKYMYNIYLPPKYLFQMIPSEELIQQSKKISGIIKILSIFVAIMQIISLNIKIFQRFTSKE